jgi:DNA primase
VFYTEEQIERTLNAIGLDIEAETSDDWLVYCPYHSNHRTPAGEVSKETGLFFCFSCSVSATLERLVMRVSNRTYFEALRLIKSKAVASNIVGDVEKSLSKKPDLVQFDEVLVARLHQNAKDSDRAMRYFKYRRIDQSVSAFSLGYSEGQDMVTVPVHTAEGMLVGFVARSIEGKDFKNSTGLPKSKVLFNLHRVKSSPYVVVVESSFDAILLSQYGIAAVASLGAGVSRRQTDLLKQYYSQVFIIPDADNAGEEMKRKMIDRLGNAVVPLSLPEGAKDVGDLNDSQLNRLAGVVDNPIAALVE